MEKTTGHICPRCRQSSLNVYYEDDADVKLGALCKFCGLKGYYVDGRLAPLAMP
jgi:hypothetical protein